MSSPEFATIITTNTTPKKPKQQFSPIRPENTCAVRADYELCIAQQPQQARATGRSKRFTGRRTIDPPPVIQVCLNRTAATAGGSSSGFSGGSDTGGANSNNNSSAAPGSHVPMDVDTDSEPLSDQEQIEPSQPTNDNNIIHHTLNPLILVASIIDANAAPAKNSLQKVIEEEMPPVVTCASPPDDGAPEFENLVGTTCVVANMVSDKNFGSDTNPMKAVFVFSNLSVKQDGNYKLRFTLYEFFSFSTLHVHGRFVVNESAPHSVPVVVERGSIDSEVFKVYTAKKFPGLTTSSKLSFDLKSSGTKIKVRHSIRSGKKQQDKSSLIGRNSIFRRTSSAVKAEKPKSESSDIEIEEEPEFSTEGKLENYDNNNLGFDDSGSVNSFATSMSNEYLSVMTPLVSTMSTSSTSSLQSAAHSFGSYFSLGRPPPQHQIQQNNNHVTEEVSPLKLLSAVSSQQSPMMTELASPPGSPKIDPMLSANGNSAGGNPVLNYYHRSRASTINSITRSNSISNIDLGYKTHKSSLSNGTINTVYPTSSSGNIYGHQHSNSHSSRNGHQSQDSLSSRHSSVSMSTPTSLYFQTPNNNHLNVSKSLVAKRSDQYLNHGLEDELVVANTKKSKPDRSQYKAAIMKISNIIN